MNFDAKQKEQIRAFIDENPDPLLVVNLMKRFGYFYLVPGSDSFYQTEGFKLEKFHPDLGIPDDGDSYPFSAVRTSWASALNLIGERALPAPIALLDIGGFAASVSLHFAKAVRPAAWRIKVYEPNPDNFALCRLNLALNHVDVYSVVQAAVSDAAGEVSFWVPPGARISGQISFGRTREKPGNITVSALAIASEIEALDQGAGYVLKLDTEGQEAVILAGIPDDMRANMICSIVEYWPSKDGAYEDMLADQYRIFALKSTMFTGDLPYHEITSARALHEWGSEIVEKHKNVDILLTPKNARHAHARLFADLVSR